MQKKIDGWLVPLTALGMICAIMFGWLISDLAEYQSLMHHRQALLEPARHGVISGIGLVAALAVLLLGMTYSDRPLFYRIVGSVLSVVAMAASLWLAMGGLRHSYMVLVANQIPDVIQLTDWLSGLLGLASMSLFLNATIFPLQWSADTQVVPLKDKAGYTRLRIRLLVQMLTTALAFWMATFGLGFCFGFAIEPNAVLTGILLAVACHSAFLLAASFGHFWWLRLMFILASGVMGGGLLVFGRQFGKSSEDLTLFAADGLLGLCLLLLLLWCAGQYPAFRFQRKSRESVPMTAAAVQRPSRRWLRGVGMAASTVVLLFLAHEGPRWFDLPILLAGSSQSEEISIVASTVRRLEGSLLYQMNPDQPAQSRIQLGEPRNKNLQQLRLSSEQWRNPGWLRLLEQLDRTRWILQTGSISDLASAEMARTFSNSTVEMEAPSFAPNNLQGTLTPGFFSHVTFRDMVVTPQWLEAFPANRYTMENCRFEGNWEYLPSTPWSSLTVNRSRLDYSAFMAMQKTFPGVQWQSIPIEQVDLTEQELCNLLLRTQLHFTAAGSFATIHQLQDFLKQWAAKRNYSETLVDALISTAFQPSTELAQLDYSEGRTSFVVQRFVLGKDLPYPADLSLPSLRTNSQAKLIEWVFIARQPCEVNLDVNSVDVFSIQRLQIDDLGLDQLKQYSPEDWKSLRQLHLVEFDYRLGFAWRERMSKLPLDQITHLIMDMDWRSWKGAPQQWPNLEHLSLSLPDPPPEDFWKLCKSATKLQTLSIAIQGDIDFSDSSMQKMQERWNGYFADQEIHIPIKFYLTSQDFNLDPSDQPAAQWQWSPEPNSDSQ